RRASGAAMPRMDSGGEGRGAARRSRPAGRSGGPERRAVRRAVQRERSGRAQRMAARGERDPPAPADLAGATRSGVGGAGERVARGEPGGRRVGGAGVLVERSAEREQRGGRERSPQAPSRAARPHGVLQLAAFEGDPPIARRSRRFSSSASGGSFASGVPSR